MTSGIGPRVEPKLLKEMSIQELREELYLKVERFKQSRENFEFQYQDLLLEEIEDVKKEIRKRKRQQRSA